MSFHYLSYISKSNKITLDGVWMQRIGNVNKFEALWSCVQGKQRRTHKTASICVGGLLAHPPSSPGRPLTPIRRAQLNLGPLGSPLGPTLVSIHATSTHEWSIVPQANYIYITIYMKREAANLFQSGKLFLACYRTIIYYLFNLALENI